MPEPWFNYSYTRRHIVLWPFFLAKHRQCRDSGGFYRFVSLPRVRMWLILGRQAKQCIQKRRNERERRRRDPLSLSLALAASHFPPSSSAWSFAPPLLSYLNWITFAEDLASGSCRSGSTDTSDGSFFLSLPLSLSLTPYSKCTPRGNRSSSRCWQLERGLGGSCTVTGDASSIVITEWHQLHDWKRLGIGIIRLLIVSRGICTPKSIVPAVADLVSCPREERNGIQLQPKRNTRGKETKTKCL